jgi:hypothetical protein
MTPCSLAILTVILQESAASSLWTAVELNPLLLAPQNVLLYRPWMMDGDCGAIGGLIGRGNRSIWGKSILVSFRLSQIPHDLNRARTRGCCGGKPATIRPESPKRRGHSVGTHGVTSQETARPQGDNNWPAMLRPWTVPPVSSCGLFLAISRP